MFSIIKYKFDVSAEHDIFGEPVSDSEDDDEDGNVNVMELDENSHLSADSRVSDSNSMQVRYSERTDNIETNSSSQLITTFSKEMFEADNNDCNDEKSNIQEGSKTPKLENFNSEYIIPENGSFPESLSVPVNKGNI